MPGLDAVTDVCMAGYYCPGEANVTVPDPTEFECPIGYYCPENSAQPIGCSPGSYQPETGKDFCINCPAGFYCHSATVPDPTDCPPYHYCPEGEKALCTGTGLFLPSMSLPFLQGLLAWSVCAICGV